MQLSFFHMVRAGPFKRVVKRARILSLAKGFRGRRKNCYSLAVRAVHKALQRQYVGRKMKKREMRSLWISRINKGAREHNLPYRQLMNQLTETDIMLNRKILSELSIHEPRSFHALAQLAKERQRDGLLAALD